MNQQVHRFRPIDYMELSETKFKDPNFVRTAGLQEDFPAYMRDVYFHSNMALDLLGRQGEKIYKLEQTAEKQRVRIARLEKYVRELRKV